MVSHPRQMSVQRMCELGENGVRFRVTERFMRAVSLAVMPFGTSLPVSLLPGY